MTIRSANYTEVYRETFADPTDRAALSAALDGFVFTKT